jgi:CRISPR-associated protein Cas6
MGNRHIALTPSSRLTLRLPSDLVSQALVLAGKTLNVAGQEIRVGVPTPYALQPSSTLYSRLVVIKGFVEPEPFLEAVLRQLQKLGVNGRAALVEQNGIAAANASRSGGTHSPVLRRTIRIHDKEIVGFAVRVSQLTAEESLTLQERGVGGRRRFGCGIFIPDRR